MRKSSHDSDLIAYDLEPKITLHKRRTIYQEILAPAGLQTLESLHEEFAVEQPSFEENIIIILDNTPPHTLLPKLQDASKLTQAQIPTGSAMPTLIT
ncbi:hypothetical protein vseg_016173 [Gypsophila vaccaria]